MKIDIFSSDGAVELRTLSPGDTFMQVPEEASIESTRNCAYIVLKDGPSRKDPIEVLIAILSNGQVLRWPPSTKVTKVDFKVVRA